MITNYTDETGHFRKWACGLRAKYGNWDDVLADPRYQELIDAKSWGPGMNCKDWPDAPEGPNHGICRECDVNVEEIGVSV